MHAQFPVGALCTHGTPPQLIYLRPGRILLLHRRACPIFLRAWPEAGWGGREKSRVCVHGLHLHAYAECPRTAPACAFTCIPGYHYSSYGRGYACECTCRGMKGAAARPTATIADPALQWGCRGRPPIYIWGLHISVRVETSRKKLRIGRAILPVN